MAEVHLPASVKATLIEERNFWSDGGSPVAAGSVAFAKQGAYGKPGVVWDVMWVPMWMRFSWLPTGR